ncbi:MFS transporter [Leptospira mtsangambouensis]|uniref:MFS transporter n=1 Tax=Leptospira mtsangambouensis TaxID=2484912 RepID=A0ABY2NZ52_9LEPT|nr:MFS transporter [Leptospira mtsangambouensis]TGM74471.1 MFS transporter [Leptospira mtsangambouensis]
MINNQSLKYKQVLIVFGAAIGMAGGFSSLYFTTLSIFLKPLAFELNWGRGQTSAATISSMVGVTLGAIFVGRLIDRIGSAKVVGASIVLISLLIMSLSQLHGNFFIMTTLSFGIGFLGVGTTALGYLAVLAQWFEKRLGLALGAAMVGLGLGAVIYPIFSQHLISSYGWRIAYITLAGISFGQGLLAWFIIFVLVKQKTHHHNQIKKEETEGQLLAEVLALPSYWILFGIIFIVAASGLGAAIHMAAVITDRGISPEIAARIVAFAGVGLVLGRLISGALMDIFPATNVAAVAFLLGGIGIGLIAVYPEAWIPILGFGAFLGGFAIGAEGDFIPFIIRKYFGMKSFGAIYGTLYGANCLGGVLGPIAFGYCFDVLATYKIALITASFSCVIAGIVTFYLGIIQNKQSVKDLDERLLAAEIK